ncbi:MAG: ABC transporter permease subunit [Coriobacteriia bacterium]
MNMFLRELKAHRTGLIWWCLGMAALVASGMGKYAAYSGAGQSATDMLSALPKAIQTVFGMSGFDLTTASGFYGVLFMYIALMGAVHAALLGSNVISEEERDKTSEFLYSKPVPRGTVLTAKLLAGLFNVVVFNLATLASSFYFVGYFSKDGQSSSRDILVLMAGLFFLQLIFFSIGAMMAGVARRPKSAPSRATSIMFLTFMLAYLVNLNEKLDFLKYLSPFKYFDAATLMADGRLDPLYVALSVAIVVLAIAGTYRFHSERDLGA